MTRQGDDMDHAEKTSGARLARHLPLAVLLCGAIAGTLAFGDDLNFETLRAHRAALLAFRDAHFAALALAFVAGYVGLVAFSLPGGAVATLTGGFLFGLGLGAMLNLAAASLGAMVIFGAARMGLGRVLTARIEASDGRLKRLRKGLHENEVSVLLLMRLVPVVPFFVANLVPALVGVGWRTYAWTTVVGILPGALVYTWIGASLGGVFERGENPDLSLLWEPRVLAPILALAALAALPIAVRLWRGRRGA